MESSQDTPYSACITSPDNFRCFPISLNASKIFKIPISLSIWSENEIACEFPYFIDRNVLRLCTGLERETLFPKVLSYIETHSIIMPVKYNYGIRTLDRSHC